MAQTPHLDSGLGVLPLATLCRQPFLQCFPNGSLNLRNVSAGINLVNAFGLGSSDRLVAFRDTFEKTTVSFLNPIAHEGQGRLALEQALRGDLMRNNKKKCDIRACVTDRNVDNGLNHSEIQLPAVALIGDGRIIEAIADDDFSGSQGRTNDFTNELR